MIFGPNRPADRDEVTIYAEWGGGLRVGARVAPLELLVVDIVGDYVACVLRDAAFRPPRRLCFRLTDGAQILPDEKLGGWVLTPGDRMYLRARGAA
jgi:hypothetical protein